MAKRFTDTEKWKRPWFRSLTMKQKLIWLYLCDDCDHAGIWLGDFDLMAFQLGVKVTEAELLALFDGKISKHGDKFLLANFFDFQYGHVQDNFSAKVSARNKIEKLKSQSPVEQTGGSLPPVSGESTSISIGIIKSKIVLEGGVGETIYELYPRKLGKKKGLAKLKTILKTEDDVAKVTEAVKNYRAYCERSGSEERFIKHFTTFLSEWEDWLDPGHGVGESFGKSKIIYPGDEDDEIRV